MHMPRSGVYLVLDSMPNSLKTARNISDAEAAVVERALEVSPTDDSASKLHSMVRSLQIISRCKCGCASIDFCSAMPGQVSRIVAEAAGIGPAGEDLGLIVWALDGTLSSLEVYSYSEHPAPLPVVASISPIGGDAA